MYNKLYKLQGKKYTPKLLIIILLFNILIRVPNLFWKELYPVNSYHSLGFYTLLNNGNPHFYKHPNLFLYVLAGVYYIYYKLNFSMDKSFSREEMVFHFTNNFQNYGVVGRSIVIVLSIISLWLLFFLGKQTYNKRIGIYAVCILCVNIAYVLSLQDVHPNTLAQVFIVLLLIIIYGLQEEIDYKMHFLAGVVLGLGISTDYPVALMFIPIIYVYIHDYIAFPKYWEGHIRNLILLFVGCIIFFFLTSPFILINFKGFLKDFLYQARLFVKTDEASHLHTAEFLYYIKYLFFLFGPVFFIGGFYEIYDVIKLKKREKYALVIFFIINVFYFSIAKTKRHHYILPVFPIFSIFAAAGVEKLFRDIRWKKLKEVCKYFICLYFVISFLIIVTFYYFLVVPFLMHKDPQQIALKWIEKNIPKGKIIAMEHASIFIKDALPIQQSDTNNCKFSKGYYFSIPYFRQVIERYYRKNKIEPSYQLLFLGPGGRDDTTNYSIDCMKEAKVDYIIITADSYNVYDYMYKHLPKQREEYKIYKVFHEFYQWLEKENLLLKEFKNPLRIDILRHEMRIYKIE